MIFILALSRFSLTFYRIAEETSGQEQRLQEIVLLKNFSKLSREHLSKSFFLVKRYIPCFPVGFTKCFIADLLCMKSNCKLLHLCGLFYVSFICVTFEWVVDSTEASRFSAQTLSTV